ncbi:hypothetical protein OMP40_34395 [Cohnella rhizosphaerae]|uniref:Uncharacterized protein n=1 Tax=Cohnella rhizosphaerae TaxID=1457232 RepID=A0A9X4QXR6_9BACL|nr:hypothetical protein [Cohnella rhizosphaerae]MDG0813807.1 hypothetical protein [Cohnella rhizosphaerae]
MLPQVKVIAGAVPAEIWVVSHSAISFCSLPTGFVRAQAIFTFGWSFMNASAIFCVDRNTVGFSAVGSVLTVGIQPCRSTVSVTGRPPAISLGPASVPSGDAVAEPAAVCDALAVCEALAVDSELPDPPEQPLATSAACRQHKSLGLPFEFKQCRHAPLSG